MKSINSSIQVFKYSSIQVIKCKCDVCSVSVRDVSCIPSVVAGGGWDSTLRPVFVFVSIIIILGPVLMSSSQVNHHCNYILLYK